ncbi:5893_t:CDS:1, partial [Gigaspora margarita]
MPLSDLRTFAYSILKNLDDEIIRDKEFTELDTCSECDKKILIHNYKPLTILSCSHVYHRYCVEKFLLIKENKCPSCDKVIEPIISLETPINSPNLSSKKWGSDSTEKSSNKKAKKVSGKSILKQLIEELLTNIPIVGRSSEETGHTTDTRGIFLKLSDRIDSAESKNEDASRGLITSYFYFGEALYNQYKELKPTYGKDGAKALVKSEVRKEIPEAKFSDDALKKRMERARKMFKIFNSIGKEKIAWVKSTPPGFILNLTVDDTDYVIAEVLKRSG